MYKRAIITSLIGIVIGIIFYSLKWYFLMKVAIVFVATVAVWNVSVRYPNINSLISILVAVGAAIYYCITKNDMVFGLLLAWVGYIKTTRLWTDHISYGATFPDEKLYDLAGDSNLNERDRIVATVIVMIFYIVLGFLTKVWTPLAFVPALFLLYRGIRIFQTADVDLDELY